MYKRYTHSFYSGCQKTCCYSNVFFYNPLYHLSVFPDLFLNSGINLEMFNVGIKDLETNQATDGNTSVSPELPTTNKLTSIQRK